MKPIITKFVVLAFLLLSAAGMKAQVSFGETAPFNDGWLFNLKDDSLSIRADYDDSKWRQLTLPHDWSIEGQLSPTLASCTGYLPGGIGWYRKHFRITDTATRHYIYFEGVYNRSEVYLNGHLLGKRPNGYISFLYDMTPYLKEGDNVLSVRVDHSRYADSRWYTGSGIYRDVWLIAAGDVHFAQWGIGWQATALTNRQATVKVDVTVEKHQAISDKLEIVSTLVDADGKQVARRRASVGDGKAGTSQQTLTLKVANPHRWDITTPYLYTLKTELIRNGKSVDLAETKVGLRTLDFDANKGFALNGRWMKVKGVCLHHDAGVLGAVVPDDVWRRRLTNLKAIGVNAIRTSHNPQAPVFYDLCDELGLLVMDEVSDEWEFPKRKWMQGWNVGEPSYDGTFDFFEEWIEQDVTDMVRRDRNHPCIFLWSIGNEVDYPNDPYSHPVLDGSTISQPMFGGYNPDAPDAMRIGKIAKRLSACVRAVDTSRPVTGALAGVVMSNQTEYPEAIDVVGYNYTEDRYDEDHATYPNRIIYGSENRSDIDAWYAVKNKDFIFGQFIWTGTDYLGESGRWPSRGLYTGLLDFGSFPKPRGYFRASLWSEQPVTYIGTYSIDKQRQRTGRPWLSPDAWDIWNYEPGQQIRVVCYTNAPQARLLLDGKQVGEMRPYDERTGIIYWDIPYAPGELRAEGCDSDGNVLSTYSIRSSARPYAIRATADLNVLADGSQSVVHITVEVVDEEGTVVKLGDNEITCRVEGPARLLGLEGSDNSDMSDYTDNRHRVYHGRLLAYIQTNGEAGSVRVKFSSPLLQSAEVVLTVE
ncbi:MAG: glycoside hydrolase family 2 TIM barrel-domain containing protein [Bacteroides sp.]|nr:glycoside hydrolase family 2 TIM barrel-domain containing protein [Bacteroides sp.]